ncbi:hypothetical protein M9Y10_009799 [Tritrichomonas musculus]|uniref:Uncharacterized protein n=1 Tax=Tritrichomonas musculus TaxID=1915356 RepID=A0ABR2IRK4_9EUKA
MHTINFVPVNINFFQENVNPARHYTTKRGTGPEALEVQRRLDGFDAQTSPIAKIIKEKYPDATKSELISVTQMIIILIKHDKAECELPPTFYKFDRITRRSKDLIIKWYSDHWNIISNYFNDVGLADSQLRIISNNCNVFNVQ